MPQFNELLELLNAGLVTISLDPETGNVLIGGNGLNGDLFLFQSAVVDPNESSPSTVHMNADGFIRLGGNGAGGEVRLFRGETFPSEVADSTIHLDGEVATLMIGNNGVDGDLMVRNSNGENRIILNAGEGIFELGGNGVDGDILVRGINGPTRIHLSAGDANNDLNPDARVAANGATGDLYLGGNDRDGDIRLYRGTATNNRDNSEASIHLDGGSGNIRLGSNEVDGDLILRGVNGPTRIHLSAGDTNNDLNPDARIAANGATGDLYLGGNNRDGDLLLYSRDASDNRDHNEASIHLNGQTGDITLRNADFAEDFDILEEISEKVEPGSLMVLNKDGKLVECFEAYDKKVTGVVSGAGDYKPGIIMDKQRNLEHRLPIALVGKVMCKVDANLGAIEAGDLLTTSSTPGHAMKVENPLEAFGATIGKALKPLKTGKEMIPILVNLQ